MLESYSPICSLLKLDGRPAITRHLESDGGALLPPHIFLRKVDRSSIDNLAAWYTCPEFVFKTMLEENFTESDDDWKYHLRTDPFRFLSRFGYEQVHYPKTGDVVLYGTVPYRENGIPMPDDILDPRFSTVPLD